MSATDCLFCSFVSGEIEPEIAGETRHSLAFRDIDPQAPTHVLVVPREHHADLAACAATDPGLLADVLAAAVAVAAQEGLESGYRVLTNTGPDAGQTVHHLHAHVLGGRPLGALG